MSSEPPPQTEKRPRGRPRGGQNCPGHKAGRPKGSTAATSTKSAGSTAGARYAQSSTLQLLTNIIPLINASAIAKKAKTGLSCAAIAVPGPTTSPKNT